ncbi:ribosomal RNA-processing protein 7 homolog A-like [Oscarella lobularis]|uniref:ribosomal RNA-processing protein 7 homolog A-like n=1 Tax=Oscarella lobularis TaxID=121494 RepID=UPI0033138E9D
MNDFKCLPVKFDEESTHPHFLYIKKHQLRQNEANVPAERTLFVVGVPPYCTDESLKNIFKVNGDVAAVCTRRKPGSLRPASPDESKSEFFATQSPIRGYKVAYVVFREESSVERALRMNPTLERYFSTVECPIVMGIRKWKRQYENRWIDPEAVRTEIEDYMARFDEETAKTRSELESLRGQADDEGWVTVTSLRSNHTERNRGALKREKKKKKEKELMNFYQFQQRETKREQIAQLRKKFEEDKQKIAAMKEARKFRPY